MLYKMIQATWLEKTSALLNIQEHALKQLFGLDHWYYIISMQRIWIHTWKTFKHAEISPFMRLDKFCPLIYGSISRLEEIFAKEFLRHYFDSLYKMCSPGDSQPPYSFLRQKMDYFPNNAAYQ